MGVAYSYSSAPDRLLPLTNPRPKEWARLLRCIRHQVEGNIIIIIVMIFKKDLFSSFHILKSIIIKPK